MGSFVLLFQLFCKLDILFKSCWRKIGLLKKKNLYRKCIRLRKFKAFFFDKLFLVFTARGQSFSLIHEEALTPARPYSTDFSPNIFPSHALKTHWSFLFFFFFFCLRLFILNSPISFSFFLSLLERAQHFPDSNNSLVEIRQARWRGGFATL